MHGSSISLPSSFDKRTIDLKPRSPSDESCLTNAVFTCSSSVLLCFVFTTHWKETFYGELEHLSSLWNFRWKLGSSLLAFWRKRRGPLDWVLICLLFTATTLWFEPPAHHWTCEIYRNIKPLKFTSNSLEQCCIVHVGISLLQLSFEVHFHMARSWLSRVGNYAEV